MDAGGAAANEEWQISSASESFASEIELDSYKPSSIDDSSKLSRNAFPDASANSTVSPSQTQEPLHVKGVNYSSPQGAGAPKAGQTADDAFVPLATSLDIGLGPPVLG